MRRRRPRSDGEGGRLQREAVFFSPDFFGFGEADVDGEEGAGVGVAAFLGEAAAEVVDGFGARGPEGGVEEVEVGVGGEEGVEGGAVVVDAFAEEGDGGAAGEGCGFGDEGGGVDEGGVGDGGEFRAVALVAGGEDLAALGVEEGDGEGEIGRGILGDDVEGGDADDFAADGLVHGAGDGDGDAESGEGAGAEGEVEFVDLVGSPAVLEGEVAEGGHELGGVAVAGGELAGFEEIVAEGDGDGAVAGGGFEGEDAGVVGGHWWGIVPARQRVCEIASLRIGERAA